MSILGYKIQKNNGLRMKEHKLILKNFKGIIDSTLREGLQFSGSNFSLQEEKKIFSYLSKIGVDYIEVGNPVKKETQDMILELVQSKRQNSPKILAHIRNHDQDVIKALGSHIDGVNIICTVDSERLAAMNISATDYMARLRKNILVLKNNNLEVRVSVEDFFNQPSEIALEIFSLAEHLHVDRIGVADTLGKAIGWEIFEGIKKLRDTFHVDIEVHFHNDLGHSVSNSLIALQAGANWVDTSLLGIGERTGITALSSLLVNLYVISPKLTQKYKLRFLTMAENYVSRICRVETPLNLLTNKNNAFAHKAGIHLNALMKFGPQKYELFPPQLVGNRRKLILNSLVSGKTKAMDVAEFKKAFGQ
jgi:homocitrate synthase